MSNIEFNQEYIPSRNQEGNDSRHPFLVHLLIKLKLAKNPQVANYILVVFSSFLFLISAYIILHNILTPKFTNKTYLEDIPQEYVEKIPAERLKNFPSKKPSYD